MSEKIDFKSEYELHTLTGKHLKELFDLELVAHEFQFQDKRFDTLAYDEKTKSFVIIEYKNELNLNVLNQGKDYFDLLQSNKDVYINRYNEKFETDLKEEDFSFDKTRVMIIGPEFSDEQIENSKNPDYPYELYLISLYKHDDENGCVLYENVDGSFNKKINVDLKSLKLTQENLLKDKPDELIELYIDFKNELLKEFSDLDIKYLVDAVSVKAQNEFLCIVNVKNSIKIHFYTKQLTDSENKTRDISSLTTGGPLSYYELTLTHEDISYAVDLVKQVYRQKCDDNDL